MPTFIKEIKRAIGDAQKDDHRAALKGNAMVLNASRWVRVTAGTDPLPQLMPQNTFTIITVCEITNYISYLGFFVGLVNAGFYSPSPGSYKNGFRFFPTFTLSVFGGANNPYDETRVSCSPTESFGKKIICVMGYDGTIANAIDRFDFYFQGYKRTKSLLYSDATNGVLPQEPIGIGRVHNFQAYTSGFVRSVEILLRMLTNQEMRRIYNLGTAHAAGLITPQDISIDFNRINGQAPICRTGSRQLTITPMNNNTPDTAGTTYVPFI